MQSVMSILLLAFVCQYSTAQWSTSTAVDSTLYVCPGFSQMILTYEDGSSVICGGLSDSRYAQKLDPFGYKIWPQPVQIMNTPGTGSTGMGGPIDDGDGGFILWWADYRGADYDDLGPLNNALYMQRVDKYGMVRWQNGGVQIDSVKGGTKGAYAVTDGVGGIILSLGESDFVRVGASNIARTWITRYDADGQQIWTEHLDSLTQERHWVTQPFRLGNRVMISTLSGPKFFDPISGASQAPPAFVPQGRVVLDGDLGAFDVRRLSDRLDGLGSMYREYLVTRMNVTWDSLWSNQFEILDRGNNTLPVNNNILPDKVGGLFYCEPSSNDSTRRGIRLRRITRSGVQFTNDEVQISPITLSLGCGFNGPGEFGMYFTIGKAFKFDTTGRSMWPQDFTVLGNPGDAYSQDCASDNNGGGIVAYWTTMGGIFAQHTGRMGKVGVITRVDDQRRVPSGFALEQNYPNPFNPTTTIRFSVQETQTILVKVYDLLGRDIVTLVNEKLRPGSYEMVWNASSIASGVYFARLTETNELGKVAFTKVIKLLLMK